MAWGLRNPYGIAFHPEVGCSSPSTAWTPANRHVIGDYDDLYEIHEGEWYGWPDFASGIRLDDPAWGPGGAHRGPLLAEWPNPEPPKPFVTFQPHAAANGIDFAPADGSFGFPGDGFVALFGDLAPITTTRLMTPAGFKVVRVEMATRRVVDFAVNRIAGPASKLPHNGFERPSHCTFGPDGALYVTDFGEIDIAPEAGGIRVQAESGTLWRVRRVPGAEDGLNPPDPLIVPFYAGQYLTWAVAGIATAAVVTWIARRLGRRR